MQPNTAGACDKQYDGHKEGNTEQVIEVIVKKTADNLWLDQQTIDPV